MSVLLGDGDGTFQNAVNFDTGKNSVSIVALDVNGDGLTDILTTSSSADSTSVLLGNGDGTFETAGKQYGAGVVSFSIAAADFNGDGITDVALNNDVPLPGSAAVLLGNGDGTFGSPVEYPSLGYPSSVVAGDFNHDGHIDLAVGSDSGGVSILLGNGDGTFQAHVDYILNEIVYGLVAGDFNGDGNLDLAVASNCVLLGNGDGTFRTQGTCTGIGAAPLAAGDFNGDGRLDLATPNSTQNTVSVMLGNGDGTFQAPLTYAMGAQPVELTAGDFNLDGKLDLATANFPSPSQGSVSILLGNGDGTFQSHVDYPLIGSPGLGNGAGFTSADLNGDGKADLAVITCCIELPVGSLVPSLSVLLGNGDGTFQASLDYLTVGGGFRDC